MNLSLNESYATRAEAFRALHLSPGIFVVPNPWDAGSAKVLESLGFQALATTSAGLAFSLGKPDSFAAVTREESLANAKSIVAATRLPVTADLENGYGDDPETCAETILKAAETGLAGGSIEDATGRKNDPIYAFDRAVERVRVAVIAARSLPHPFTLTARAENLIHGKIDVTDTINRLVAFADVGADVLFAPGLMKRTDIEAAVAAISPKPLNMIMGITGANYSLEQLQDMGVKRVSLGSALVRAAYGAFIQASKEILTSGTFTFAPAGTPYNEMNKIMGE